MAKARKQRQRKPIPRQTRHFQLRVGEGYPVDNHVREVLDYKKSKRLEVTHIRDGVRLLWALENNDLSVLWELFPHLKQQIITGGDGGAGGTLEDLNAKLELLLAQASAGGYMMKSAGYEPKPIPPAPAAPPVAIVKPLEPVSADSIADNFLNAFS